MASSLEFQENFFQCPICLEDYTAPKVLLCQHTFCKQCIHEHIMQEVKKVPGRRGFPCPLCKTFTETNLLLPPEQWSDQLITNFTLSNMMEALLKKGQVTKCSSHNKALEYTCRTHQKKICSDCAVFDHRTCDIVAAAALEKHENLFVEISEKSVVLSEILEKYESAIKEMEEEKGVGEDRIKCFFQKIHEQVNAAEKDQLNLLQCKYNCELDSLKESHGKCKKLKEDTDKVIMELKSCDGSTVEVETCLKSAENIRNDIASGLRVFNKKLKCNISIKSQSHLEDKVQRLSEMVGEVLVNISPDDPDNNPQDSILSKQAPIPVPCLPTGTMNRGDPPFPVGQYPPGIPLVYPEPQSNVAEVGSQPSSETRNGDPVFLTLTGQFNAKISTDSMHSWLTGACVLSNGNIVLADRNNKKVKLFNPSFVCIAYACTDTYPFDITQCYTGEIAVTIPKEYLISFYNPMNLVVSNTFINTEQPCLGIVSFQEKLYVCCDTTWSRLGCIKVYDKYNNLLQKLDKDSNGKDIVSVTDYLAICNNSGNLVFKRGGFSRECLYSVSTLGTIVWKARMQSWSDVPQGLVGLNDGIIAVCGGSIKYISPNNSDQWKDLVPHTAVESPCAVALDSSMTKLIVTQSDAISNCKKNNYVLVFNVNYNT